MESPISRSHRDRESKKSSKSSRHRHRSSSDERSKHKRDHRSSDSDNDDRHRRNHHKKSKKSSKDNENEQLTNQTGEQISLSIEETNKLRAKLGLKPLSADENKPKQASSDSTKKTYIDKDTNQEFEHVPAKNIAEIREQKEFKQKLEEQKEKRRLAEKIRQVKSLAEEESDQEYESVDTWLQKVKEKQEAAKKAKSLEEMDKQFEQVETKKEKKYTSTNLKGLRVEHDQARFKEGEEIILTLKDKNIIRGMGETLELDEEEETDVLVNVNLLDDEKAAENVENKKKKPNYNPFEDEFDEDGNFVQKSLLSKYDEELDGSKQKKSFKLGTKGLYDASDEKFIKKLEEEHKQKAIKLDLADLKPTSDYMTQEELEKFKKPKKVRKVLRSKNNKMLKADDLLPLPVNEVKNTMKIKSEKTDKEETDTNREKEQVKKVSLKNIDFGFNNEKNTTSDEDEGEIKSESDTDDDIDYKKLRTQEEDTQDLKKILEEENQVLDELHSVLSKTRQKITNSIINTINIDIKSEQEEQKGVNLDNLDTVREEEEEEEDKEQHLVLDSISEFCRNIGNNKLDKSSIMQEKEEEEEPKEEEEEEEESMQSLSDIERELSDMEAENESKSKIIENDEENVAILDEEPVIDRGLASALKLAVNKGYLGKEKDKQNARLGKSNIQAQNFTIEERNYYDIDDKYNRNRDKYSGPLTDFDEKKNYKPDIKLDYFDEKGHAMNEKEAFRYLSHKFHGKGPGKKKTEKRLVKSKEAEAMNKMSSVDTPLNTVALLMEKQKKLQQPYVVLSAQKGKQDQVTLHKR